MADLTGLNERISSWFEPKPAVVNILDTDSKPPRSPKGFWHIGWKYVSIHRVSNFMTPLDFLYDESANAMLLEAMPAPNLTRFNETSSWECHFDFVTLMAPVEHADRKTAIVLAFCKWAGIPVEEEL